MAFGHSQSAFPPEATQENDSMGTDALREALLRDRQQFLAMISRRDRGEAVVLMSLTPLWFVLGSWASVVWTWYLTVPVLIWSPGFTLVYQNRHRQPAGEPGEPLQECAKRSLKDVEAQIWLLRNVFWWCLLPLTLSLMTFFVHTAWQLSGGSSVFPLLILGCGLFLFVIFRWVYSLNQRARRTQLEPRRQTLLELIALLDDGGHDSNNLTELVLTRIAATSGAEHGEIRDTQLRPPSLRRTAIGLTGFLAIMAGVIVFVDLMGGGSDSLLGAVRLPKEPEFDDVSSFSEADSKQVDAWLQQQMQRCKYPSLSVAVVRDGEIVYLNALGLEDISEKKKATSQTQYNVASVTKVFTASLVVMLHERGVLDLDQPVVKYLPGDVSISTTPEVGAKITLRQLASHTSGLPRGVPGRVQSVDGWYELEPQRLYRHLADVEMESDPGTEELYSNLGFGLLGHALERAADKPFDQLMQEMICDPLQLQRTAIPSNAKLSPATGYDSSSWRFERTHSLRERLAGSGGLVTTVEDLAKFLAAQMEPGVFSEEMLRELHGRSTLPDGTKVGASLGWTSRRNPFLGRILEKNGGRSNCNGWIGFSAEQRVGVAVVTNCGGPDVDEMGRWLLERSAPGAHQPVTKSGHFARVAPYSGVRWKEGRPVVRVDKTWAPLVSMDGISVDRIMEFAQSEFGDRARKRFAEDVVELLTKLGHEPNWELTLGLRTSDGTVEYLKVRMTEENRNLIRRQDQR